MSAENVESFFQAASAPADIESMAERSGGAMHALFKTRDNSVVDVLVNAFWLLPGLVCIIAWNPWVGLVLTGLGVGVWVHTSVSHRRAQKDREARRALLRP